MNGDASPQPTAPVSARPPDPPRLLDQLRQAARQRGHLEPTVVAFVDWGRRFILFHGKRHPRERNLAEVGRFLEHVAQTEKDPVRAIAASRDAVAFLYREALHLDLSTPSLPEGRGSMSVCHGHDQYVTGPHPVDDAVGITPEDGEPMMVIAQRRHLWEITDPLQRDLHSRLEACRSLGTAGLIPG